MRIVLQKNERRERTPAGFRINLQLVLVMPRFQDERILLLVPGFLWLQNGRALWKENQFCGRGGQVKEENRAWEKPT